MKKSALIIIALSLLIASCATKKEVVQPPKETKRVIPPAPVPVPEAKPEPHKQYRDVLNCEEKTGDFFNRTGIEVLPFIRLAFFDMDNDGRQELIAGSKDGSLRLYRRAQTGSYRMWQLVDGYFEGIRAGAFSSPAVGDLDGDKKPELVVGTGGFSSESGRVLVYRNTGTASRPVWEKADMPAIDVGDDATPALLDVNGDGKSDLIIGNSTGALFLHRNSSAGKKISFTRDTDYFKGVNIGMYGMPAATSGGSRLIIIAGNSMGKLYLLERQRDGRASWQKTKLKIEFSSFAAPSFIQDSTEPAPDLVVSDSNGQIHHYKNKKADYRGWEEVNTFFADRIMPGPACTPAMAEMGDSSCMITGNISGELKLYEFRPHADVLPWIEKTDFFKGIKLSGFSKGIVTMWRGRYLLITGQQDGPVRAFLNTGTEVRPVWKEQKDFFRGVPKTLHASPVVFDLDGDGAWELILGDVDGRVTAYRMAHAQDSAPVWRKIEGVFDAVRADRYASPALIRDRGKIYLFVGQHDGRMQVYSSQHSGSGLPVFSREDSLKGIQVSNHSSPTAFLRDGRIELSVGDYNGNLRHYACRKDAVEVKGY